MDYLWLPLALVSAVTLAASDALVKRAMISHNEYLVMWLRVVITLPFLLAILPLISIPTPAPGFYRAFFISLFLEVAATILYMKALKISPLSVTLPFLSLTPVFLLVIPFLLLGERISPAGCAGILLIAAGSYTLNLEDLKSGLLGPLRAIRKEPGAVCMIVVAFIYSFTSTLGKQAITASSPLFFAVTYYAAFALVLTPVALAGGKRDIRTIMGSGILRSVLEAGILNAVMIVTHMLAINLATVAYMIAVKRTSLLFGVIFGRILFQEGRFRERIVGAALMLAGVAAIAIG